MELGKAGIIFFGCVTTYILFRTNSKSYIYKSFIATDERRIDQKGKEIFSINSHLGTLEKAPFVF